MIKIHSYYDPPIHLGHINTDPTMTQQHFQEECDINNILAKFTATGILDTIPGGIYEDITTADEYRASLHKVMIAESMFGELPANLRKEFDNDPYLMLEFINNPKNIDRGIEIGLYKKPEPAIEKPPEKEA
ncbi:MAG: internal scaffolding protein [Microvirus sp.]|nr:MAG: internal scaffolding protein [Microvirus sp.]